MALLDLRLREFLDEVASEGRTPGGGSVAAAMLAAGAAQAAAELVAVNLTATADDERVRRARALAEEAARAAEEAQAARE